MSEKTDPERQHILDEIRQVAAGTVPSMNGNPDQGEAKARGNLADAGVSEWLRSRTFKIGLDLTCDIVLALALALICGIGGALISGLVQISDLVPLLP